MGVGNSWVGLRPFFSYLGGKWGTALRYPPPRFPVIVEPFAGAAGYALRYYQREVILVEKNPRIAAIWRWLIEEAAAEDILALPRGSDPEVDTPASLGMEGPAADLASLWFRQCVSDPAPHQRRTKFSRKGEGVNWGSQRLQDRLAFQVEKIKHWRVIEGDFSSAPEIEATWFVDPPYQGRGHQYPCGSGEIDFQRLGRWCRSRRGQVIVCEESGANWLPFRRLHRRFASGGRRYHEVIWTNDSGG